MILYFGDVCGLEDGTGYLYAVEAETGEVKWKYKAGSNIFTSPAVLDGVVYFGCNDGMMYALE